MDTAQPKRRLKAFLKHATIRISTKHHGDDSASAYSIDDDGRSQRSSHSVKKDSKLRRIGRGIREWRSKRRRLRGDTRPENAHTLEGKRFSSEESISERSFDIEDFSDEDEPVDRPEDNAYDADEAGWKEPPEEKVSCEIIHEEVAVPESAREQATPKGDETEAQSGKEVTLPRKSLLLPAPIDNLLVGPDLAPYDKSLKPTVFRRDRKDASDFAQSTLNTEPAFWTDASHRPVGLKGCKREHHGGIAVAQKLDQRWKVHSAYISRFTDCMQLELFAILTALQKAILGKQSSIVGVEGTIYICSDSDASLQWVEKALALATAIEKVVQGARALEANGDVVKRLDRFCDGFNGFKVFRPSEYSYPEQSPAAWIGRRILEQYFELRRLGYWVEFHWVPAHCGLPGNEVADRMSGLSRWWLTKVAPSSPQGTGLVIPLEVRTFDESWNRNCPHKGQPGYSKDLALQLLEDTKSSHVVLAIKAPGPESCNTTSVGRVEAGPDPDGLALKPAPKGTCRLLQAHTSLPSSEDGEIKLNALNPPDRTETPPNHNVALELRQQMGPILQPPSAIPQPKLKARRKTQRGIRPTEFKNSNCTHCWYKGHPIHQCFERFPEQKVTFSQRYAHYIGRPRLEKVMLGAFYNIARLHPQLMPLHGQDSRYMVGWVGMSPHRKWLGDIMKEACIIYKDITSRIK